MYEQISIFDIVEEKPKPYQYDWVREVGKPVRYMINDIEQTGIIKGFDHYYTYVYGNGCILALTTHNCRPADEITYHS